MRTKSASRAVGSEASSGEAGRRATPGSGSGPTGPGRRRWRVPRRPTARAPRDRPDGDRAPADDGSRASRPGAVAAVRPPRRARAGTQWPTSRSREPAATPSVAAAPNATTTSRRRAPPWGVRLITPANRCSSSRARPCRRPLTAPRLELELERPVGGAGPSFPLRHSVGVGQTRRLRRTSGGPGNTAAPPGAHADLVHMPADVGAPGGEFTEEVRPHADDLGRTARPGGPAHTEPGGQAGAQVRLVDRRRRLAVCLHPAAVAGAPAAVASRARGSPSRRGCAGGGHRCGSRRA